MGAIIRRITADWSPKNEGYKFVNAIRGQRGGAGSNILDYYTSRYKASAGFEEWRSRIERGCILLNGGIATDAAVVLKPLDTLTYFRAPWAEPDVPNFVDVLFEDEDMVILDKPAGLQVLPGADFHQRTVLGILHQEYAGHGAGQVPVPVHRLGRGTSGLLLCARSPLARSALSCAMTHTTTDRLLESARSTQAQQPPVKSSPVHPGTAVFEVARSGVRKVYRALVQGTPREPQGHVDVPIGPIDCPGLESGLHAAKPEGGKHASSRWKVLSHIEGKPQPHTLVEVEIFTGRPHQIRIHMAAVGHPLVRDPLFGLGGLPMQADDAGGHREAACATKTKEACASTVTTTARIGDCGYFLRAHELSLHHPRDGRLLTVFAPPCPPFTC